MNETTRHVVGSLAADIGPSQSPSLHEQADVLGPRYAYERIDISALGLPAMRVGELFAPFTGIEPGRERMVRRFAAMASAFQRRPWESSSGGPCTAAVESTATRRRTRP